MNEVIVVGKGSPALPGELYFLQGTIWGWNGSLFIFSQVEEGRFNLILLL